MVEGEVTLPPSPEPLPSLFLAVAGEVYMYVCVCVCVCVCVRWKVHTSHAPRPHITSSLKLRLSAYNSVARKLYWLCSHLLGSCFQE